MKRKGFFIGLFALLAAVFSQEGLCQLVPDTGVEPLFEYPQVPDELTKVNMRSNFMVEHLWDDCNLEKEAIADIEAFRETFTDYASFFILADMNVIEKSVKKFVDRVSRNENNLRAVLDFVETEFFSPSSQYWSDDVYTIFAKHLTDCKRVDKAVKQELETKMKMIANSRVDTLVGDMNLAGNGQTKATLHGIASQYTILFFNVEECIDCSIFKLRLSTDIATANLVKSGIVSVVSVYDAETEDLGSKIASETAGWHAAKIENMADTYDLRILPCVYVLDADKKILAKSPSIEQLLTTMAQLGNAAGV